MNNISQITNFSTSVVYATIETLAVYIGNTNIPTNVNYYVLPATVLTDSLNTPIIKLGYVCEPKGIDYPIVIKTGGQSRMIYIGKTGMFETMPETFLNINDSSAEELNCTPEITEIKLPKSIPGEEPIKFKLDYIFVS